MNPDPRESLPREILEELMEEGAQAFRSVLEKLVNLAMELERSEFWGAEPYERTRERRDHANGFKNKTVATRVGRLKLKIPQVRNLSFYPKFLKRGCRSEKALKLAIAEMYMKGGLHPKDQPDHGAAVRDGNLGHSGLEDCEGAG